jgi:DNA-binding transcriptional LysR family regulator
MTLQTEDIAWFLAVVREGSFGRAATSLLVSQPAVSERIARLEREAGAPLFRRSARGATLTPAGEAFVPYAERTLELLDEAVASVGALGGAPRFRVAVHTTFAHRAVDLVLGALGPLRRSITVRDAHSDTIVAMLIDGACDVGFVVPGARPQPLRFVPLPADPVVAVVAPSHPLARTSPGLPDLAGHRVAFNRFGSGAAAFVARLRQAGVPEWQWTECSDALTALHLAAQHRHVALVTRSVVESHGAGTGVVPLRLQHLPRWTIALALAYRTGDRDEPAVAAVRQAVERLSHGGRPSAA